LNLEENVMSIRPPGDEGELRPKRFREQDQPVDSVVRKPPPNAKRASQEPLIEGNPIRQEDAIHDANEESASRIIEDIYKLLDEQEANRKEIIRKLAILAALQKSDVPASDYSQSTEEMIVGESGLYTATLGSQPITGIIIQEGAADIATERTSVLSKLRAVKYGGLCRKNCIRTNDYPK
jgi:hypothetical protein